MMSSLQFNAVLLDISNQLTAKNLEDIKFLNRDTIGKRELERIDSGVKLFQVLTERSGLAPSSTERLCRMLRDIHRDDLCDKLTRFDSQSDDDDDDKNQPDQTEKARLDTATEVITEHLGRSWRKLGRRLGVSEVKLDSISRRHPTELEETAMELLKEWRKSRGAQATAEQLLSALRACQFNLTADKVEQRLNFDTD